MNLEFDQKNEDDITKKIKKEIAEVRKYGGKIVYTKEQTFSSSKLINLFSDKFSELHRSNIRKIKKNYTYKDIFNFFKDLQKIKILVVGETIIDEYNFCEALGKSGKEPTLVLRDLNKEIYLGGAAAISRHLSSFLDKINLLSMIGEKEEYKDKIKKDLPTNISFDYIKKNNSSTIIKRRFLDYVSKNKILGVYSLNDSKLDYSNEIQFQKKLKQLIPKADMVIVSDYGHGLISKKSAQIICKNQNILQLMHN